MTAVPKLTENFRYRREVDGLRAVAVLAVLLFHADLGLPGGYVGVDVFFVISGYLITTLILRDVERGQFSMAQFWERRIRRIWPPLVVMVLAVLLAGWCLLLPADFEELGRSAVWQTLCAANFFFWRESGYFAGAADEKPLLHTWSLAVEEQFYLIIPVCLASLGRFPTWITRRHLFALFGVMFVVSLILSIYGVLKWTPVLGPGVKVENRDILKSLKEDIVVSSGGTRWHVHDVGLMLVLSQKWPWRQFAVPRRSAN